jgi:hypothetical protein
MSVCREWLPPGNPKKKTEGEARIRPSATLVAILWPRVLCVFLHDSALGGFKVLRAICKTPIFFNERPQPTFRDWLARCDQRETQDFRTMAAMRGTEHGQPRHAVKRKIEPL